MVRKGPEPSYFKKLQFLVKNEAIAFSYTSPEGKQNAFMSQTLYGQDMLNSMMNQVADAVYIPVVVPSYNAWKLYMSHLKATQTYRNNSNNECTMTLYDITPRHDIPAVGDSPNPLNAWSVGNLDAGAATFDYQCPGATPFTSPAFTTLYRVIKVTKVVIPAGGSHEHSVWLGPKRTWNQVESAAGILGFKGLTMYTMAVFRGAPVAIVDTSNSTIGEIRLDTLLTYESHFKVLYCNTALNKFNNTLNTTPAYNFVNDETATVVTPSFGG